MSQQPSRSFQFKTVDVQFWRNEDGKQGHNATAKAASIQQKDGEMYGQYSVSRARGNEMMSDIQQQTQRTFYTVVTKPERREEYEAEVYLPSRSVSQDVEASVRRSANRQSIRSNMSNGTASGSLPRVKMHTIRASDRVPIVRVSPHTGSTQKIETSHLVTGSMGSKLNDISGKSVVRDSESGKKMVPNGRGGSQPPGKVTYQYKVDASERRVEYRYHSETILYDYEQTTKREQLETWSSQQLATNKERDQFDIAQFNNGGNSMYVGETQTSCRLVAKGFFLF